MSSTYSLTVHRRWFDLIRDGKKRYEGRRWFGQVRQIAVGDLVRFSIWQPANEKEKTESIVRKVVAVHRFGTFEQGLTKLPLQDLLPGVETVEQGRDIYFQYVSLPTQLRDGVVFLELSVITDVAS